MFAKPYQNHGFNKHQQQHIKFVLGKISSKVDPKKWQQPSQREKYILKKVLTMLDFKKK
jgi:hypothetical protein